MKLNLSYCGNSILVSQIKNGKNVTVKKFTIPFSVEEFKLWYDVTNQHPTQFLITMGEFAHYISSQKFEAMQNPELEIFKLLFAGQIYQANKLLCDRYLQIHGHAIENLERMLNRWDAYCC